MVAGDHLVRAQSEGYADGLLAVALSAGANAAATLTLLPFAGVDTLTADGGGEVIVAGAELGFPPGAVLDPAGQPVAASVAVAVLDPAGHAEWMPGGFVGDVPVALRTRGRGEPW